MVFQRHLLRTAAYAGARVQAPILRQVPQFGRRRTYASATDKLNEVKKSSDLPWLLGSLGVGVPAAFFLLSTGPEKKPHHGQEHGHEHDRPREGADAPHEEPKPESEAARRAEADKEAPSDPAEFDEPRARKAPYGSSGAMSDKQEGLDNADSSNPYINEPGKSVKGEGETETTKLKGTVSTERKQE